MVPKCQTKINNMVNFENYSNDNSEVFNRRIRFKLT